MNYLKPQLLPALAGEYVLGSLKGAARRRFERLLATESAVQAEVARWQARLQPLADRLEPVEPARRVWSRIEARIGSRAEAVPMPTSAGVLGALVSAWWRRLAFASSALAGVLVAVLFLRAPPPERPPQTVAVAPAWDMWSVLLSTDNKPQIIVCAEKSKRYLWVMVNRPQAIAADRSLELWMLPEGGQPRSLGLVPADGVHKIELATTVGERLGQVPALAISLEPAGGSKTGLPTGPVLYTGAVLTKKTT